MNSAEFKTLRESVGLSVKELSDLARLNHPRPIRYWEEGRRPPEGVCDILVEIDGLIERGVVNTVNFVTEMKAKNVDLDDINLYRYTGTAALYKRHPEFTGYPVSVHAAMLARATRAIRQAGYYGVKIQYWVGDNSSTHDVE